MFTIFGLQTHLGVRNLYTKNGLHITFFVENNKRRSNWSPPVFSSSKKTSMGRDKDKDCKETAFMTPQHLYKMCVTGYGLCNSQSTYQRIMDDTLEGVDNASPSSTTSVLTIPHLTKCFPPWNKLSINSAALHICRCRLKNACLVTIFGLDDNLCLEIIITLYYV